MKTIGIKHTTPPGGWRYTEPLSGVSFTSLTFQDILNQIAKHRRASGFDMPYEWRRLIEHLMCEQNQWSDCTEEGERPLTQLEIVGRQRWKELHEFALAYPELPTEQDKTDALAWLNLFDRRVPNFGGCNCIREWEKLRAETAPDLSSREAFYMWTARMHNKVNARIGKPQFPETLPE